MAAELVPFDFHGDRLDVVQEHGRVLVAVRGICDVLGLDAAAQQRRLRDDRRAPWATTAMTTVVAGDGRNREMFCLDLESLPMWLATIDVARVTDAVRPKVIRYQRECARVLADHFLGRRGAPALDVRAAAETFAQQSMRVLDDPVATARLRRAIKATCAVTKRSWSAIEGVVRRATGAPGWTRIALFNLPNVYALLDGLQDGVVAVPSRSKPKPAPVAQRDLFAAVADGFREMTGGPPPKSSPRLRKSN